MKIILISIISASIILILACTNHNEEEYFETKETSKECDTLGVSFSDDIFPVFENYCISCHNSANPSGGISLENYSEIKPFAESGLLTGVIDHEDGYSPMPKDAEKLPECTISKFRAWVNQGLENN